MSHIKKKKKRNKALEEFIKMETSNIPDVEFKALFIRMVMELRGRVDEVSENFNKEI